MKFPQYSIKKKNQMLSDLNRLEGRPLEGMTELLKKSGLPVEYENDIDALMQDGTLRDGDGVRFPGSWDTYDLMEYLKAKEKALAALSAGSEEHAKLKNSMFTVRTKTTDPETGAQTEQYRGITVSAFQGNDTWDVKAPGFGAAELTNAVISARAVEEIDQKISASVETFRQAFIQIADDLAKTDSVFSSDSDEYKKLSENLKAVSAKLKDPDVYGKFTSLEDLYKVIKENEYDGGIFGYAEEYEKSKASQKDALSDRQLDRISVCKRVQDLGKLLERGSDEAAKGNVFDLSNMINGVTALHKGMLGKVKSLDTPNARRIFREPENYTRRFGELEGAMNAVTKGHLEDLAKLSPEEVDGRMDLAETSLLSSEDRQSARDVSKKNANGFYKKANKNSTSDNSMDPVNREKARDTMAASAMLAETANMLDTLKENDSFTHSREYKNFKKSIEQLQTSLHAICIDSKEGVSRKDLLKSLDQALVAADTYQLRHMHEDPADMDPKIMARLGVASKIRIMQDYLKAPGNFDRFELSNRFEHHNEYMKNLLEDRKQYNKLSSRLTLDDINGDTPRALRVKAAGKEFRKNYKEIFELDHGSKVIKINEERKLNSELKTGEKRWRDNVENFKEKYADMGMSSELPGMKLFADYESKNMSYEKFAKGFSGLETLQVNDKTPENVKDMIEDYNKLINYRTTLNISNKEKIQDFQATYEPEKLNAAKPSVKHESKAEVSSSESQISGPV